ncbi:OmpA family protein [Pseudomonas sp.]|uniref:OmpA family protein n=1 Tax=Pseudomonas sp. TaxID=306 RepID=UPI00272AFB10|nr:OmpA family protein [Pseudomonas sp.]
MKVIKTLAVSTLVLTLAACSSRAPTPPPEAPPVVSWAEPRVEALTAIAEAEGYELEREGEQIRLIIPVNGNFHPKRTLLLPSGLVPLSRVAKAIKDDEETQYAIVGHSNSAGDDELNKRLSLERAQSVASVLLMAGVSRQRLQLSSMGEDQPRADNATETGRNLNHRVEIVLTPYPARVAMAQ